MHGNVIVYTILTIVAIENFEMNTGNGLRSNNNPKIAWNLEHCKNGNSPQPNGSTESNHEILFTPNQTISVTDDVVSNFKVDCKKSLPAERTGCLHMPAYTTICPPNFHQIIDALNRVFCYIITENQDFPPRCPYSNFLPFYEIEHHLSKYIREKTVWLHAFRNITSGFPQFEWTEAGSDYGKVMLKRIINGHATANRNCLILEDGKIIRVSCSEKHSTVCMYSLDNLQEWGKTLCSHYGYENCIVSDYNLSPPKCFCLKVDTSQPDKYSFCEKLAEPIYPYQSELLIRHFENFNGATCWFGLYKPNTSKMCKWWTTQQDVTYTRWAKPESCDFLEGAFIFDIAPYYGWSLVRDRTLKCAVCEVMLSLRNSSMKLKYLPLEGQLELTIYNYSSISKVNSLSVYCFTDTNDDDFKRRIPIKSLYRNSDDIATTRLAATVTFPGYYWCDGFQYDSVAVIRSNRLFAFNRENYGFEFVLYVSVKVAAGLDPFITNFHIEICNKIAWYIQDEYQSVLIRPMRAYFDEQAYRMILLLHITTRITFETSIAQYKILYDILKDIPDIKIIYFRSSEVCLPDITTTSDNDILKWPSTHIGATAIPTNRLCLDETIDMQPVTRRCAGDFLYGARWELPVGNCFKNTSYSDVTEELFDLTKQNTSAKNRTKDLVRITDDKSNKQPIDVHLVSVIVEDVSQKNEEDVDCDDFGNVINNIMHFDKSPVKKAQRLLNSTDKILSALDDFMKDRQSIFFVSSKIIIYVDLLEVNGIGGLALYNKSINQHNFNSYEIIKLFQNSSFDRLLDDENLETAVLLSSDTVAYIKENFSSNQSLKLVIIIFYNDLLFTEPDNVGVNQQSKTKIVSISVPGFKGSLDSSVKVAFRMPKDYLNTKNCSHWNYGLDQFMISIYGKWKTDAMSKKTNHLLEVCEFFHMTHFGLLLQGTPREIPYNETVLEILTIIGSILSLLGIIPIFITAAAFKTWRSRPGNIILINFCIAITIQIILLFSSSAVKTNGVWCIVIGVGLHYIVLSEFCWMFVVALLQHRRFVLVFQPQEDNIIQKCLAIGWGVPLIPVVVTISISTDNYTINEEQFCTVRGYYYLFGYLLPIILILCINIYLFATIIYSVSKQTTESCAKRSRNYKLEILLALFLFFALGMTWVFGIIGAFGGGVVFTYLFCIFATLRGLVLFLFFIVGNKETRLMWNKRYVYHMTRKWRRMGSTPSANNTVVSSE